MAVKRKANKKIPRRGRKKASTGRIYVAVIMLFMVIVMTYQITSLYKKNEDYKETEASLQKQVDAEQDKQQELEEYEQYVGSDDYIEDEASQKLGLTHDNWIIFREKQD